MNKDFKKRMEQLKKDEAKRKKREAKLERPLMQYNQNAKKEIKRERRVTILLTDAEYECLSQQAAVAMVNNDVGTTLSDFIRRSLLH